MVIDALEDVVGHGGLLYVQNVWGSRFGADDSSMAAASKLVAEGKLQLNGHTVALEQVRLLVTNVSVCRVASYVSHESLLTALRPYGNVSHIDHVGFRDRPHVGTGTRVVRTAMTKPLPKFIYVQGYHALV